MAAGITVAVAVLGAGLITAAPAHAGVTARATSCVTIKVIGKKAAVRISAAGDTVANSNDRVFRYVCRGSKLTSCVIANGYGQKYSKCGRGRG
ncbi:hypothetical protein ACWCQQ_33190 [Streptomyces sp. NPDC002143]